MSSKNLVVSLHCGRAVVVCRTPGELINVQKKMSEQYVVQELTRGEEEVMQILWSLERGSVNEIIARMREPKPKYTTVATFIKILEGKGYVGHTLQGKSHCYFPLVEREVYAKRRVRSILSSYFGGSLAQLVSFFSQHEDISTQEMNEILEVIKQRPTEESSNDK